MNKIPRLHLYVISVLLVLVTIQFALRVIFWFKFNDPGDPISPHDLLWAFYLGTRFDIQASLAALLPILILGWIRPLHPVYSKLGRKLWLIYTGAVLALMYLVYVVDAGHYAYLEQRVNATALRFLENPKISAYMVWQTYPVITGGLLTLLVIAATIFLVKKLTGLLDHHNEAAKQYWRKSRWYSKTLLSFATFIVVVVTLMSSFPVSLSSWYPLRWSDAFFSIHPFSSQLASNPVIYFSNTLKNVEETYNLEKTREAYPAMVDYLKIPQPDEQNLNYDRPVVFKDHYDQPFNVVVIILESFASYKSTLSGNPLDTTPNIKFLADNGYYFKSYFSPCTGTARSVWTFTTGIPDIEKNKTSSRNPLIVNQHTIINAFKGYDKFYFLGGSASWANIRGLLSSNIPDLQLYEEGSYTEPDVDVWGISDLGLFREANKKFKAETKPFFAVIQTSGNHRPYTIPEDNAGFKIWTQDDVPGDITDYGFKSLEELNSYRFMDHSVGEFIRIASKEPYFENTLFVMFGDHGIHAPTGKHIPVWESQLRLQGLRVPLVMYNEKLITKPRAFDKPASETDVLPTIAGLTHTDYTNTTLGRDLTDASLDDQRYAFTIEHGSTRTIGLFTNDYYLMMQTDGSKLSLHDLNSTDPIQNSAGKHPEKKAAMKTMLNDIWQTIRYVRENNGQESHAHPGSQPEAGAAQSSAP